MQTLQKMKNLGQRTTLWQRMAFGLSLLGLAGALVGFGAAGGTQHVAASCDPNDVMACGAKSANEFIGNITGDTRPVYDHFGLPSSDYDRFKKEAVAGVAKKDGTVVDDKGNVVMTNAWSIGRTHFPYATPYTALDSVGKFYKSANTDVLQKDLPVMILFDKEGSVQFAAINSCGNPIKGKKVASSAVCKDLIMESVKDKENTYRFKTVAQKTGFAQFVKFDYYFNEGNGEQHFATTENASTPVEKSFTKNAVVTVKITVSLPGKNTKVITSKECMAEVKVEKEKPVPVVPIVKVTPTPPQPAPAPAPTPGKALPETGPAGLVGLFAGVSAAGAAGHRIAAALRTRRLG